MHKRAQKILIYVLILSLISAYIALPSTLPIQFSLKTPWKEFSVDTVLKRGPLDLKKVFIPFQRSLEYSMGLDIQGGTRITMRADMSSIAPEMRDKALESSREIISRRVDMYGIGESVVRTSKVGDEYRVIAELPGITDSQQAVTLIGSTAQLDFREEVATPSAEATMSALAWMQNYKPTGLTGKDLKDANVQFSQQTSEPVVSLSFTDEGKKKFAEITTRNVGKQVAIFLDGYPLSAPTVNEPILTGDAVISGGFRTEEAQQLSIQLSAGALPVSISVVEQETIGASLGQEAVNKTFRAGFIGLIIVMVFMILMYGWSGFLADLALIVYALVTIALYKLVPVTLTLPGVAGLLLSIGMAVDSNILIFERMKEEIKAGKPFETAMELGFGRAWDSIKDANVATLFTCFILFNPFDFSFLNRSGMVRGFALTLALGIGISLFTGIVVTRSLLRVFLKEKKKDSWLSRIQSRGRRKKTAEEEA
jgi:preprotein translocase subunit SecD